jgi:hypothetical protein
MAQTKELGISDSLDEILDALAEAGFSFSVIEPDGITHGWMTTEKNTQKDGSVSLWFGLIHEGDCFRFDVSEDQVFDVYEGECRMLRLETEKEVKAFLLGHLMGFTGRSVQEVTEAVQAMAEDDPYRRCAELHKSGWCPIWNDWQYYFTERR